MRRRVRVRRDEDDDSGEERDDDYHLRPGLGQELTGQRPDVLHQALAGRQIVIELEHVGRLLLTREQRPPALALAPEQVDDVRRLRAALERGPGDPGVDRGADAVAGVGREGAREIGEPSPEPGDRERLEGVDHGPDVLGPPAEVGQRPAELVTLADLEVGGDQRREQRRVELDDRVGVATGRPDSVGRRDRQPDLGDHRGEAVEGDVDLGEADQRPGLGRECGEPGKWGVIHRRGRGQARRVRSIELGDLPAEGEGDRHARVARRPGGRLGRLGQRLDERVGTGAQVIGRLDRTGAGALPWGASLDPGASATVRPSRSAAPSGPLAYPTTRRSRFQARRGDPTHSVAPNSQIATASMARPSARTTPASKTGGRCQPHQVTPGSSAARAAVLMWRWLNTSRRIGSTA